MKNTEDMMWKELFSAFYNMMDAVYMIDKSAQSFTLAKGNEFFEALTGKTGDLDTLYENLLFKNLIKKNDSENKYKIFRDKKVFELHNYQGTIVHKEKEQTKTYGFYVLYISQQYSGIILKTIDDKISADKMEKEKIDTIQQGYLFSMLVDLKEDACINLNTTEISGGRQDYMQLKYSDWRKRIADMLLPDDRNMFLLMSAPEYIIRTLTVNPRFQLKIQMPDMQGQYIWVCLSFDGMKNFSKENPRFAYSVRDIHQEMCSLLKQENIIKAVEEQNEKLKTADKAKSIFISNMSHEIRTPINAVLGMNEMIIRETTDDRIRAYAYDIKNASKILLSVINDILDYSKLESGKMEVIPAEYTLPVLIDQICSLISNRLREKGLEFELDVDKELPYKLFGDEVRITQIIVNLLTNAVKYTDQGKVTFEVKGKRENADELALYVSVKDTGIGIKQEDMGRLFEAFGRLNLDTTRKIEGTGLGISIVVRLLEQMGSKLDVESEYGVGSRFSFVLMQKIVDNSPIGMVRLAKDTYRLSVEKEKHNFTASKAKILVIDDNHVNLKVVKALLKTTKMQVDVAWNGEDGLSKIQECDYQLVLMDHFMPNMDGVETLKRVRLLGGKYEKLPIIALTANASSGAKDKYRELGFADFLEKPIDVDKMERVLEEYIPESYHDKE